jgi:nucleotide-binding universal stress UspA family protein
MPPVFERILLATERTEFDGGAERLAIALARRHGEALAIVMPLAGNAEYEAIAPELAERGDRSAAASLLPLREAAGASGVAIDLRVRHGVDADREIVEEARERAADLIVIRRRGRRSFLAQLLVGEMVGRVLAHTPCNVLIVPRDAALWSRRVLLAAEPGEQGRRLLALALALATEGALPLSVVCVLAGEGPAQRRSAEAFVAEALRVARDAGVPADGELLAGAPASRILDAAQRHAADLIVMGLRDQARSSRARVGAVAQQVTGRVDCAVLLARPADSTKEGSS